MNWITPLFIVVVFELVADIFSKEWSLNENYWFWFVAMSSYIIAIVFWLTAIRQGVGLGRGILVFSVASAVIALIIGIIFYKEGVTKLQLVGMLLGVLSITLVFW